MRQYYNGRTETLRSCTAAVAEFLRASSNKQVGDMSLARAFRRAVDEHKHFMNEARKGHGIDRHLFGLWCAAYESKMDIPAFYDDPMYTKSGGGGNFVLVQHAGLHGQRWFRGAHGLRWLWRLLLHHLGSVS